MQPVSGDQYYRLSGTAAGTTVIKASATVLNRVVLGNNKTGTVTFYDDVATPTNIIAALNNTSGTAPLSVDFGAQCKRGLIAVVGGTTDVTVIYQ